MDYFREDIKNEQKRIQRLIDLTEQGQPLHGENLGKNRGWLSVNWSGDQAYCYEVKRDSGGKHRKHYLGTGQSAPVQDIINSRFRDEKLQRLEANAALLQQLEEQYQSYDPSSILAALPRTYRDLMPEDRFNQRYRELQAWAAENYERNPAPLPEAGIFAKDGTQMRSKGECIFYNIFDEHRLPNRYDCMLEFFSTDGRLIRVSPDFLIKCFDGSYIIIEHLGWYSGLKYGVDFGTKCYWYLQNGFILGQNLFVTSDDSNGGTDSRMIEEVVRQVERKFYGY